MTLNDGDKSSRSGRSGRSARSKAAPSRGAPGGEAAPAEPSGVQSELYAEWQGSPAGDCARQALELLARRMSSGWPRRGHSLLELYCANGYFLEMFWQSGFDVTGQDQSPELLAKSRERLRNAAEFTQANPEQLPYDDGHFDYVVCLAGMDFAEDPPALVKEMFRVAAKGVLLAFPSSWSLHCLGSFIARKRRAQSVNNAPKRFYSPLKISTMLNQAGDGTSNWASALIGPAWSWKLRWMRWLNQVHFPFPFGAISMVRVDLEAPLAGDGLIVGGKRSFKREAATSSLGRMSKNKGE